MASTFPVEPAYLEGKGNFRLPVHELNGPEDAHKTTEFWADQGVTSFKAFMHITRAELKEVIETAHKRGLSVTGHLCSVTYREAAELGIDNIEHGFGADSEWDPAKKPDTCGNTADPARAAVFLSPPGRDASHAITLTPCKVTWTLGQVSDIVPRRRQESRTRG